MVSFLFKKVKQYIEIKKAFRTASFVLQNEKYCVQGNNFFPIKKGESFTRLKVKVNTTKKNSYLIKKGALKITPYKYLFMDDKMAFSFVRGKERFALIKDNIETYLPKLPYKTMNINFILDKNLIISNVVSGDQHEDAKHLWLFLEHYLDSIDKQFVEKKQLDMLGTVKEVLYYPQHGDCHTKNIFWNKDKPTLIDLDDVDLYPLFYDLFYYIIALKHEEAFTFFRTREFEKRINAFISNDKEEKTVDTVDLYLGAYVYFWVNKMKKKMNYHEINFYFQWFEKADLSSYQIVSESFDKYRQNLIDLGIRNGKS